MKRGNKGEASNSCQVPVCTSMICVLFPFASFFSLRIPSDRISLPGPSASNALNIDFSVALPIGLLCSKLCLTQLKISELLCGLLQSQDCLYGRWYRQDELILLLLLAVPPSAQISFSEGFSWLLSHDSWLPRSYPKCWFSRTCFDKSKRIFRAN